MTRSTPSRLAGLAARLATLLFPPRRPALQPVPVRRLVAVALLPLALAPEALAQRGGTTGRPDRSGPRRDTVAVQERPAGRDAGRPDARRPDAPGRSGDVQPYDGERQRRPDDLRRADEQRQREAEQRLDAARRGQEQRARELEQRQREQQERMREQERQREQQERMREQRTPQHRLPGTAGYDDRDDDRYDDRYDRYWGSSWSPVLRYRQRVRIESDRAYSYGRQHVLEIRTHYRQRTSGSGRYGERLDVRIERLDVLQNGRYLGSVDAHDLPSGFDRVRATRARDGSLRLDEDLLLVGEAAVGFELIRFDGDDFYGSWRRRYDAVALDLRRSSVRRIGSSRLFDPYDYRGYAPVSIVPDFDEDFYGYGHGGYDGYDRPGYGTPGYDRPGYGTPGYDRSRDGYEGPVRGRSPRGATQGSGEVAPQNRPPSGARTAPQSRSRSRTLTLPGGQQVQVEREADVAPAEGGN